MRLRPKYLEDFDERSLAKAKQEREERAKTEGTFKKPTRKIDIVDTEKGINLVPWNDDDDDELADAKLPIISLYEISEEEIWKKRVERNEPGFILKKDDKFYYTPINKETEAVIILGENLKPHKCSSCGKLRATLPKFGGCYKVKDLFLPTVREYRIRDLYDSKRIEKYPFIRLGVETFNFSSKDEEYFLVFSCSNFKHNA